MESIISPVERHLLLQELTSGRKLENTNRGGNEIYVFDAHEAPDLMREVARLREEAFRAEGGCTGKSMDIDSYDVMEKPYRQLIVWDPDAQEIIGGYRFIIGKDVSIGADGRPVLATAELFDYSEEFLEEYLPHTIELGRSFVSPGYQSSKVGAKTLFALDNLWDGIVAIMMTHRLSYFFGKVTIHPGFSRMALSLMANFLSRHFKDTDDLVWPKVPIKPAVDEDQPSGGSWKEDYLMLKKTIRDLGFRIPPMLNSYISLSPTMKFFGFSECHDLVGATEGGILINFHDVFPDKRERHINAYLAGRQK